MPPNETALLATFLLGSLLTVLAQVIWKQMVVWQMDKTNRDLMSRAEAMAAKQYEMWKGGAWEKLGKESPFPPAPTHPPKGGGKP